MSPTKNRPSPETIAKVVQHFRGREEKQRAFLERYGHARVPMCSKLGGKWLVVVGGKIYKQTQEDPYIFLNVLHDHALTLFGIPFLEGEEAKPFAERHPAIQWMHAHVEHIQRVRAEGNHDTRAEQTGSGAAWFRFAYDLFTIGDNATLEARLVQRLLDPKSFQAARHELRIAALFVVAGFKLDFEDEQDNARRHPEFIATDRFSDLKVAVEVKSRHRKGVQGFESGREIAPGDHVDIRGPVLEAFKKDSALPLYVFVDANLPPVEDDAYGRWLAEIDSTMLDLQAEGYLDACPANLVVFTNDPSHYLAAEGIGNDRDRLWIKYCDIATPRIAHPNCNMIERVMKAYRQRLIPPADFPDFQ